MNPKYPLVYNQEEDPGLIGSLLLTSNANIHFSVGCSERKNNPKIKDL